MPEGTAENFDFAAAFDALYDWWAVFNSTGRKDMVGKKWVCKLAQPHWTL
jgi:hypothetical protein